jgi:signal transduction histidine kinase
VAALHVEAPIEVSVSRFWGAQAGLGVIGAGSMLALLLVYRHSRGRLRAVGAIREALLAIGAGEGASSALAISSDLGVEASAWNQILDQSEKLRHDKVAERARESLGDRRRGKSDLDDACDVMTQGILLFDENMRCKYANGAAAVFLQTDRDKLTGADIRQFVRADKVKTLLDDWASGRVRQRTTIEAERDAQFGDGVLRVSIRPVRREDTGSAMLIIEDITQQRVAEEARHAFVAHATHELRTPLTNIRLYVETALDDGENDAILRAKCLNVINSESRRLERIVNDLLSTAEIESGSFSIQRDDVHLDALFAELQADYEAQAADKKISVSFNLPPKLPIIQADRDMITLALHNLISNALKYTPAGGKVQINVDPGEHSLTVDVVDTGIGISDMDQGRLFEKFYRAQDKRIAEITGSGLGLALAREVVRLHGGDITVQSKIDHGSTFTMTIPAAADAA